MSGDRVIVSAAGVSRRFGDAVALDRVSFTLRENVIYGLLGRNGAGKTTLMQILTGQQFASAGTVEIAGVAPLENDAVLSSVCFVRENLRYPDWFKVRHALRAAACLFPNWDEAYATRQRLANLSPQDQQGRHRQTPNKRVRRAASAASCAAGPQCTIWPWSMA